MSSSRALSPTVRRPRIAQTSSSMTISPASSSAALVPRSAVTTGSRLARHSRSLSPSTRHTVEPYSLWQPIFRASDQVVLYNPSLHAINVVPASSTAFTLPNLNAYHPTTGASNCPYCHRPMDDIPPRHHPNPSYGMPQLDMSPNYFQLLQDVNGGAIEEHNYPRGRVEEADDQRRWSRVSIDSGSERGSVRSHSSTSFVRESSGRSFVRETSGNFTRRSSTAFTHDEATNEPKTARADDTSRPSNGYYATFFREETRLGMGANGSVFLCQHVLNGIPLGHFAVKKIAVGESTSYLMEILREVRLHEKLHHPNIITYHHAWLESARFSSFGLAVPTLHVLMQWAELGSLDDLILQRLGARHDSNTPSGEYQTREDRIRAFRAGGIQEDARREAKRRAREMKAVHLLGAEEIRSLFGDVVAGLAFLHESSFLHLDLKPGNVLLTQDEGKLMYVCLKPRAMLSDFGTAQDALQSASRERSGNTGTLEYSAPESLGHNKGGSLPQPTAKSDMWSLGMILHKLIYFRLPWKNDEDMVELEKEIIAFRGFRASSETTRGFARRRLPHALCHLLSKLLDVDPFQRPGSDQVLKALRASQLDPTLEERSPSIGPLVRRPTPPVPATTTRYGTDASEPDSDSETGRKTRPTSRRSDKAEVPLEEIPHQLLALDDGPARTLGWLSAINVSRELVQVFKGALLISKTVLLMKRCAPTPPTVPALALVIGLALVDMWTSRMRWSFALFVAHLVLLRASRSALCTDLDVSG